MILEEVLFVTRHTYDSFYLCLLLLSLRVASYWYSGVVLYAYYVRMKVP